MDESAVYAAVGEDGFRRLVGHFYREVPADPVLGPMYPAGDVAGAEERLRNFLVYRFGGPQRYIEERGHPRLRMRHAPFAVDERARRHWLTLMGKALDAADFAPAVRDIVWAYFEATAAAMINRL